MSEKLLALIERARKVQMTPQDIEEQRISFAYGNAHYENHRITREMVARYPSTLTADEMREGSRS
jgi:hypothetical protein